MKIFNTLTRQKEEFVPIEDGKVRMYVCGPTVYNYIHIGNARPMIIFDTVRRYFEYKGFEVNYVSNFTDVDDKIIKKAIEEGVSSETISERYIQAVREDMEALNIKQATKNPKATEEIDGMIAMIDELIKKGHAYEKNGTVYFRTRSFSGYGKLSKKNIDDLESGHREIKVAGEEEKEDALDFVLWKPKKEGEPAWESPWSDGRPGWHIECSVMSKKYLGDQIDIHAGGEDLIFPHHENEIAQSEAANGKDFAKYWMHNGFLNINNKKMSKSEGNFFTVREIGEKYPYEVLRFFMLSGAHYRMPLNFSQDLMEAAKNGLERICVAVERLSDIIAKGNSGDISEEEKKTLEELEQLNQRFDMAMEDDFNTADAVSVIFEMVKLVNVKFDMNSHEVAVKKAKEIIDTLTEVLGVKTQKEDILDEEIEQLIEQRQEARKAKDFAKADEIRDILLEKGIVLKDTREGVKWTRA
ncbi:MAG: cysteine--tRNA ligase [Lachnospiraceae bacterium]|nr:cysteine--tRNA ligase [Lachnospiraceae bacterium]